MTSTQSTCTYSAEANRALCRLQHRGLRILDAGAANRARGIIQAHLLHYSRRRGAPSEAANNVVRDLAVASGIEVPLRHQAELTDFIRDYLTDLFARAPDDAELFWDVCGLDYLAPLPFYRYPPSDGLNADWKGRRIWLNPPDACDLARWVAKAAQCEAEISVCFLPLKPGERWFREHVAKHPTAEIRIVPRAIASDLRHGDASQRRILVVYRRSARDDDHASVLS